MTDLMERVDIVLRVLTSLDAAQLTAEQRRALIKIASQTLDGLLGIETKQVQEKLP